MKMTSRRSSRLAASWGAALALALTLALGPAHAAAPRDTTLAKEDQACLDCHAKPGLRKTLANGESLSLYIAPEQFANSMHNGSAAGCGGCHSQIDEQTHGKAGHESAMASKRSHAVESMETCRDCHQKTMKKYEDSVHSALLHTGSAKAPLCADCHNPHATKSQKQASPTGSPDDVLCQQCHKEVAKAFTASVHGTDGENLECKDCHRTHDIKAASAGDHLRGQCLSCHKEAVTSHATWLPNAGRHLEAVSCAACHTPNTTRRVDLRIYESSGERKAAEKVGVPQFVQLASTAAASGGLDGRALWSLLQDFSRGKGDDSRTFVRGRLEVQTGVEAHSLAAKGKALKDCATCHKQGAAAFQSVTVSMIGPDGRPQRQGATRGILNSVESIGSVGGFYAIGGTRIKLLDVMLLMALAGGIMLPGAHLAMKLLSARKRKAAESARDSESN
jgi:predicted CXXCH cytochrome family protein